MSRLATLERFARAPLPALVDPADRCGICAGIVEHVHHHVVDVQRRKLACACRACHLVLAHPRASTGGYRILPERVLFDRAFALSDAQWATLQIPVGLTFLTREGERWIANHPSAAGATQAEVPAGAWAEVARAPLVAAVAPDVEALLVYARLGVPGREIFLVPIDLCYALVGLVRREWRGLSGGAALWRAVGDFFAEVRARAQPLAGQGTP